MLMVVHNGKTKLATLYFIPSLCSAHCMVTGKVAADDFEKKASDKAGNAPLNVA